ncbi:MAG: HAD family hydrolase [Candidatus Vogelbacteria bacterium]|nr:HAD family hydrolase [Candidatus Vogelbacteria bacterium]
MEEFNQKHVALDFDNTVAYFEGGREGIFNLFENFDIKPEEAEKVYEMTKKDGGFNIDNLIEKIKEKTGKKIDIEAVKLDFINWLKKSLKLYPDAKELFARLEKQRRSYSIISVGNELFQRQKIAVLGLKPKNVSIVARVGDKPSVLQNLALEVGRQIIYIDDKASELDAIRRDLGEQKVLTVRIDRPDSPYRDEKAQYKHVEIKNLGDLRFNVVRPLRSRFLERTNI